MINQPETILNHFLCTISGTVQHKSRSSTSIFTTHGTETEILNLKTFLNQILPGEPIKRKKDSGLCNFLILTLIPINNDDGLITSIFFSNKLYHLF